MVGEKHENVKQEHSARVMVWIFEMKTSHMFLLISTGPKAGFITSCKDGHVEVTSETILE